MAIIQKSKSTQVRVELSEFNGRRYVDIREWYMSDDEYKPGKGTTIPLDKLDDFKKAVASLEAE